MPERESEREHLRERWGGRKAERDGEGGREREMGREEGRERWGGRGRESARERARERASDSERERWELWLDGNEEFHSLVLPEL